MSIKTNSGDGASSETAIELLRRTRIEVAPQTFALVGLSHEAWAQVIQQPELSPRVDAVFMILRDARQVTLLLEDTDWRGMRHAVRDAQVERGLRLLTFDIELAWNVIGYFAHVAAILAKVDISVGALSAFSRDHLLIKQDDLALALRTLSPHVAELC